MLIGLLKLPILTTIDKEESNPSDIEYTKASYREDPLNVQLETVIVFPVIVPEQVGAVLPII